MSVDPEFATVDLLIGSTSDRRGVDAFALSVIKVERQVRRIFTHIVYQSPAFGVSHIDKLIDCLASNNKVYFEHLVRGIDSLSPIRLSDMYGERYETDHKKLGDIRRKRNKIFHGQLTGQALGMPELLVMVEDLRSWSVQLAKGTSEAIGYDGIGDSYQKSQKPEVFEKPKSLFSTIDDYECFLRSVVQEKA